MRRAEYAVITAELSECYTLNSCLEIIIIDLNPFASNYVIRVAKLLVLQSN